MFQKSRTAPTTIAVYVLLICCCTAPAITACAQASGNHRIAGTIKSPAGHPLPGVHVLLRLLADGSSRHTFTDTSGHYRFNDLAGGKYMLSAGYAATAGFSSDTILIGGAMDNQAFRQDIILPDKVTSLQEVVVQARQQGITIDKDKIVVNVQHSAATSGKSAFDLLKQLPGVSVGQEDEIQLRASTGINVMIDGKMNYLSGKQLASLLKGISAENISKIELSAAPPAEFDAAGNAGIINIITKRNTRKGYAVDFRSAVTRGSYWMVNQNITTSLNTEKLNIYGLLDFNTPYRVQTSQSGNSITEAGQNLELQRANINTYKIKFYTYRAGVDWQIAARHQLSAFYHGYFDNFRSTNHSTQYKYAGKDDLHSFTRSLNALKEPYYYDAGSLSYQYDLDSSGGKITADAHYISYRNFSDGLLTSQAFDAAGNAAGAPDALRSHQPGFITIKSLKADVELPYSTFIVKGGLKYAAVANDNRFRFDSLQNGHYVEAESMSNHFKYTEHTAAAYISIAKKINKTGITAGLRSEYTRADGHTVKQDVKNKWSYTRLFPTLSIEQEIGKEDKLSFAAGRRINRPSYSTLNPVRWYVDQYYYYSGNPDLVPEMAWQFSSSYTFKRDYVLTASYSHRNNYLTRLLAVDSTGAVKSQSANFRHMQRFDLLLSAAFTISPSWNIQVTGGTNYTAYPISLASGFAGISKWAANVQVQQQLKLPAGIRVELSTFYYSGELWGVYLKDHLFYCDAGIRKSFLDDNLSVQVSFSDFLRTNRYKGRSLTDVTNYHYYDRPDSHRIGVSLHYHIGGKLINKKGSRIEEQDRL